MRVTRPGGGFLSPRQFAQGRELLSDTLAAFMVRRKSSEASLLPLNTRCHILGTNIEHTYIYELLIIYLVMRVRYVFHYLPAILDYDLQLVTDL